MARLEKIVSTIDVPKASQKYIKVLPVGTHTPPLEALHWQGITNGVKSVMAISVQD